MDRSANRVDSDWRREWEEEGILTPQEQKEADELRAYEDTLNAQIREDIRLCMQEIDQREEEEERRLRDASKYLKERGWRSSSIFELSDEELLRAAEREAETEWYERDYWECDCFIEDHK